ncbi:MAG: hypothetical protein U5M50_13245 [Sphingobium sp.]|nr:hypothetical protein [Sphingobium sp.]
MGELIDFDFESMDLNRLYRSSDALYKHRDALQEHLFGAAKSARLASLKLSPCTT